MSSTALKPRTVELLFLLVSSSFLVPVESHERDRKTYCESCVAVAQEIEQSLTKASITNRQAVVDKLLDGAVCAKVQSINDKFLSPCQDLLDSHYEQFHEALLNKEPKNVELLLCYEESMACMGVKRQTVQDSTDAFTEEYLKDLLQKNKENLRIAQPVSTHTSKDEL